MALSPVTNHPSNVVDSFIVKEIISGYRKDIGIDVSNYFTGITELPLFECPDTKMRFFYPPSLAGDGKFYSSLEDLSGYYNEWRWDHDKAYPFIPAASKVLDIGCGRGSFLEKLKKEKNCKIHGLELNPSAFRVLQQKQIPSQMQTIEEHSLTHKEHYDVITFFQVLEHISSVRTFIQSAIECLKTGGLLIAAVPHNKPYMFGFNKYDWLNLPPHHMGWWNDESLKNLSKFFPLEVVKIIIADFRDYNNYLKTKAINLKIMSPGKLIWFKITRPIKKIWIQIIRDKIPGVFVMAVYKKI
jgi:SAM-dependent methyltransferase